MSDKNAMITYEIIFLVVILIKKITNYNFEISTTNIQNKMFGILIFRNWNLFEFCYLCFGIFKQYTQTKLPKVKI